MRQITLLLTWTIFLILLVFYKEINAQASSDGLVFCCDEDINAAPIKTRISQTKCKEYSEPDCFVNRYVPEIVGGIKAAEGSYPHMAAIGFLDQTSTDPKNRYKWVCGGSLISELYVLTAAHCTFSREYGLRPSVVKLGTISLLAEGDPVQVIEIESVLVHPSYRAPSTYHDIALLKLRHRATFTLFVRPVCLYQAFLPNQTSGTATGWGLLTSDGDPSNSLMEVGLSFFDQKNCTESMGTNRRLKNGIQDGQLCAGYKNKDTCKGDSGGPLMITSESKKCVHHLVGITSFGRSCAVEASAVYTRVFSYLQWIEDVVWPGS